MTRLVALAFFNQIHGHFGQTLYGMVHKMRLYFILEAEILVNLLIKITAYLTACPKASLFTRNDEYSSDYIANGVYK